MLISNKEKNWKTLSDNSNFGVTWGYRQQNKLDVWECLINKLCVSAHTGCSQNLCRVNIYTYIEVRLHKYFMNTLNVCDCVYEIYLYVLYCK
uniref:Uncharacterized protein n=1 Tax=Octopus bimaculoides TaxID=37653 RepID=A0A0L8FHV4_OCTBM